MEVLAEQLDYSQQRLIYDALASAATPHVSKNQGLFSKIDFEPVANPSQDLRTVSLKAVPTSPDEADELATIANPRLYPYLRDNLERQGALIGFLKKRRYDSGMQAHTFPINIHQTMPDIALYMTAVSVAEHRILETPWHEIVSTNGLILSRGVSSLGAFGMAASEVVQKGSTTFLSFPRTRTTRKLMESIELPGEIDFDKLVDNNNERMRAELMDWLPAGFANFEDAITNPIHPVSRKRVFVAWSGSTDNVEGDPFNPDAVTIEPAHHGILVPLKYGSVLPTVTWDRGDDKEPIFITGEMTRVKSKNDIGRVQEWQRNTLAKALGLPNENVSVGVSD